MGSDTATLETIRSTMKERGVEFIFAQFVDLYGRPSAKLIPAANLDGLVEEGAGFAGFAAGEIGQLPSDPDIAAMPDLASFTLVPWQPNLARFACDVTVEGEAWPYCPRTILRNMLAKAAEQGYEFKIGMRARVLPRELNADGTIEIADKMDTLEKPCYDMSGPDPAVRLPHDGVEVLQRARLGQLRKRPRGRERAVRAELRVRGRAHELRPCHLLPLHGARARRAVRARRDVHAEAVHEPDRQRLPLPHVALEGRCERVSRRNRSGGLGLSATAYAFIGGLKAHARAYSALTAPTVNSYKRLKLGSTSSGATWSPVWISYGYNNRTQMLRIPAPGRIEDRTVDGSCNPYLAATAVLAAGLDGIANGLDAGEPNSENLYSFSYEELTGRGLSRCPRACPSPSASSSRTTSCAPRSAGPRRGLHRLLRGREARRVVPLPRAGERLGGARVPDPVLTGGL